MLEEYQEKNKRILKKMSRRKYRFKLLFIISIVVVWFFAAIYVFRFDILMGMGNFLVVENSLESADIIFLLTGGVDSRPFHAEKIYDLGLAPKIVISQAELSPAVEMGIYLGSTKAAVSIMKQLDIPDSNIVVIDFPGGVTSTRDEAKALQAYVEKKSIKKVIIVTNEFHSRRARFIFKKQFKNRSVKIIFSNAPHHKFDETNWWKHEAGLITYLNEYLKLIHYVFF